MNEPKNINEILEAMNIINTSFTFDVFIPSLGKNVSFRQMTTGQQKMLTKMVLSNAKGSIFKAFSEVLKTNCTDKGVNIDNFTLVDLYIAILKTRIYSVGDSLTLVVDTGILEDEVGDFVSENAKNNALSASEVPQKQQKKTEKINLNLSLTKMAEQIERVASEICIPSDPVECEGFPYKIEIGLPSLKSLIQISSSKTEEDSDDNTMENLVQYIKKIYIVNDSIEDETKKTVTIDMDKFDMAARVKMVDRIPMQIIKEFSDKLTPILQKIAETTLYNIEHKGKKYAQILNLMSLDFFTVF